MSRERTTTIRCAEQPCRETHTYRYTSQREYAEITASQQRSPWKCLRHARADDTLSPERTTATGVLVAGRSYFRGEPSRGLYWTGHGYASGYVHGPGFQAFADDFPEGTRLIVTVTVEIPAQVSS